MTAPLARSAGSIRSTHSTGTNETTELLPNECSTPIRSPTALGLDGLGMDYGTAARPRTPPTTTTTTRLAADPRRSLDPSLARRASMSLSPELRARRLSNASLVRSRSIADFGDGEGNLTRDRLLALLCVCILSIGSHFTSYILGPLKSRLHRELGSTNSQFSLLVSSLSLNSTWTPLVGGILVSRFGTAWSSIVCTGAVLLGEMILYHGATHGNLVTMASGLFLFGLGVSPLSVVQETLLARLSPGGHLGLSLALGLVSGKLASFISAMVSLPLAEAGGDGLPFLIALILCALSFGANLARLAFKWGESREGVERVAAKRIVKWEGVSRLGDVYYVFIIINMLCGAIWSPFLHLSANIVQLRFDLTESQASLNASVLLAGAMALYPIVGYVTDNGSKTPRTTFYLFFITCLLTLLGYLYLILPVKLTRTPWPGLISWSLGHGASPLLLVVIVARILPSDLVPLGLGMHKAMETAAATLCQTLAGLWLDFAKDAHGEEEKRGEERAAHSLLVILAAVNVIQFAGAVGLWRFEAYRRHTLADNPVDHADEYERLPLSDELGVLDEEELDEHDDREGREPEVKWDDEMAEPQSGLARSSAEKIRSIVSFKLCLAFIAVVWIMFFATAWSKL